MLPIFYFSISLVIYLNDHDNERNEAPSMGGSLLSPSTEVESDDFDTELSTLSFIISEVFRGLLIAIVGIYTFYKNFAVLQTGTFFWSRSFNSAFNILSHLYIFLALGATIITLIVTVGLFLLDLYLSYIIYIFWQNLKYTKTSTLSSDLQSELDQRADVDHFRRTNSRNITEEIKAAIDAGANNIPNNENDNHKVENAYRRNEESKEDQMEIPHIFLSRDDISKPTAYFDDIKDFQSRKDSLYDAKTGRF
jgi:hypothetical protein